MTGRGVEERGLTVRGLAGRGHDGPGLCREVMTGGGGRERADSPGLGRPVLDMPGRAGGKAGNSFKNYMLIFSRKSGILSIRKK